MQMNLIAHAQTLMNVKLIHKTCVFTLLMRDAKTLMVVSFASVKKDIVGTILFNNALVSV